MYDGFDNEGWLKACRKCMVDTFPREDPFSILVPAGFDIDKVQFCSADFNDKIEECLNQVYNVANSAFVLCSFRD